MTTKQTSTRKPGIYFMHLGEKPRNQFPAWRYHEWKEPVMVHNTDEDEIARKAGWEKISQSVTSVRYLMNWRFDLEDLTPRQLVLFAKDEFDVELPVEVGAEKLFKAIWKLHTNAPMNRENVVLFAQSVEMNYDETLKEIKRRVEVDGVAEPVEEFWA